MELIVRSIFNGVDAIIVACCVLALLFGDVDISASFVSVLMIFIGDVDIGVMASTNGMRPIVFDGDFL